MGTVRGRAPLATVDVITVTFNSAQHVDAYLEGLARLDYPAALLRLVVVDNASADGTVARLQAGLTRLPFPAVVHRNTSNAGFGAACNRGAEGSAAEYLLFLNPDAVLGSAALQAMVERAERDPAIGLVDAVHDPLGIPKWVDPDTGDTDWCSGAALLAHRTAFHDVGGFDPFFFLYAEDVDLSWRMWLSGRRCVQESAARVHHERTTAEGASKPIEVRYTVRYSFPMRFIYDRWGGILAHVLRGVRYLVSPRTPSLIRRSVADGLWTLARGWPHLWRRRRWAQPRLSAAPSGRYVFTEWYYGRWLDAEQPRAMVLPPGSHGS